MIMDNNNKIVNRWNVAPATSGRRTAAVAFVHLLLVATSNICAFTPTVSQFQLPTTSTSTRLFVSMSSPDPSVGEESEEITADLSVINEVNNDNNKSNPDISNFLDSGIFQIGVPAVAVILLASVIPELFGIVMNIAMAIGTAILSMLKVILPTIGKGVADGVTTATPIVMDAAKTAAESQIVRDATNAVASSAAPVLDTVGQAVDDSIILPLQQAVDTTIVSPIQQQADSVGDAIGKAITPLQQAIPVIDMPELPTLPVIPEVEVPDPSITIGNVRIF